ncbi:MAG: Ig-like domain-containing protein [Clostridioides sp.]|jgi:hypothetical protein|nr:Ig-like domain-containing protein [Clostridioides sp.]
MKNKVISLVLCFVFGSSVIFNNYLEIASAIESTNTNNISSITKGGSIKSNRKENENTQQENTNTENKNTLQSTDDKNNQQQSTDGKTDQQQSTDSKTDQQQSTDKQNTGVLSELNNNIQNFFSNMMGGGAKLGSNDGYELEHTGIKGSMTKEEYDADPTITSSNEAANEAWYQKHGFDPDKNVVEVSDWKAFRKAYIDNSVSKIVLKNDIKPEKDKDWIITEVAIVRQNSIEIDGQGHKLEIYTTLLGATPQQGSLNLGKPNITNGKDPVFYMHDITCIDTMEGYPDYNSAWAFINGGDFDDAYNKGGSSQNYYGIQYDNLGNDISKWYYRIGNVSTKYKEGKGLGSHYIPGRLIQAIRAEISVWGYNDIVTGSENFYVGKLIFEPYCYYLGTVTYQDYSVIWFIDNKHSGDGDKENGGNTMGDGSATIGHDSFVFLCNATNYTNYPAIYKSFNSITVEENATYNVSVGGNAFRYNTDGATFTAKKGSVVNLLSRYKGSSTFAYAGVKAVVGITDQSVVRANNTVTTFEPGSEVYIYGNCETDHNEGVINFTHSNQLELQNGSLSEYKHPTNNKFIIDNPKAFVIRNNNKKGRAIEFGKHATGSEFIIKDSDIDTWNNTDNLDGNPTGSYPSVEEFRLTHEENNENKDFPYYCKQSSTDGNLEQQFQVDKVARISGLGVEPKVEWEPITDADKTLRARIILGLFPVGGEKPFDENGDAIVAPIYADNLRIASMRMTLPNGTQSPDMCSDGSTNNNGCNFDNTTKEFSWRPHAPDDVFRTAGEELSAVAWRNTNMISPEAKITVIDITPPEPAKLTTQHVYPNNLTTKIHGEGEEVGAKVTLSRNGTDETSCTSEVGADGKFELNLPNNLAEGDVLQIFLNDKSGNHSEELGTANALTNNDIGNANPSNTQVDQTTREYAYRDAKFKEAATIIVEKPIETPLVIKKVDSDDDKVAVKGAKFTIENLNEDRHNFDTRKVESDKDGKIDFGTLLDGNYTITEDSAPFGYKTPEGHWTIVVAHELNGADAIKFTRVASSTGEMPPEVVADTSGSQVVYKIGNEHGAKLEFTTVKMEDLSEILPNVGFDLYLKKDTATDDVVTDNNVASGDFTLIVSNKISDSKGYVDFGYLDTGVYMLVQTKTPKDYDRPVGQWEIAVDNTKPVDDRIIITGKGAMLPPAFAVDTSVEKDRYKLPVMKMMALPYAGRNGVLMFFAIGLTLIEITVVFYRHHTRLFRKKN